MKPLRSLMIAALLAACAQPAGSAPLPQDEPAARAERPREAELRAACRRDALRHCPEEVRSRDLRAARACLRREAATLSDDCAAALGPDAAAQEDPRGTEYSYGPTPLQDLRLSLAPCPAAPLVVFVHGGAWSVGDKDSGAGDKAAFYNARGYHFATVNYRLHPEVSVAESAGDVASAVAWLTGQRPEAVRGVALQGHSAGAHLAALVALDGRYLARAGVPQGAIKAVSLLDGAGYDIAEQVRVGGNGNLYRAVFGDDPARWAALSPMTYATGSGTEAAFVAHYVAARAASAMQSQALAKTLNQDGVTAAAIPAKDRTHASLNRRFGEAGDPVAEQVIAVLSEAVPPCMPGRPPRP